MEKSLNECLDELEKSYGHMQGCRFRVWVDRVSSAQIGSDTWLVKFDKWELSGDVSLVFSFMLIVINYVCFASYTSHIKKPN